MFGLWMIYVNGRARCKVWAVDGHDAIRQAFEGPTPKGISAIAVLVKMGEDEQQCLGVSTY